MRAVAERLLGTVTRRGDREPPPDGGTTQRLSDKSSPDGHGLMTGYQLLSH